MPSPADIAGRAWPASPNNDVTGSNLIVADISNARDGDVHEVASFNPNHLYPAPVRKVRDVALHSTPLSFQTVATEDPALSKGINKVVMWSDPIIRHGLIYVIDIRNGLYVLRYTGAGAQTVNHIGFYEGNSNLGAAIRLANPR